MKKRTNKRRNILSVLAVMAMLVAALLTACSSGEATEAESALVKEETPAVETSKEVETVEQVKEDTAEPEATTEQETTNEVATETTIEEETSSEVEEEVDEYAQIDMESTLPGVEWIQTFDGIIDEPKLIVFNDSTNKKIILEDYEEVEFYDDDTLAVYIPKERGELTRYLLFEEAEYYDNIVTLRKMPSAIMRGGYPSPVCIDIELDGKPVTLYCSLKLMG